MRFSIRTGAVITTLAMLTVASAFLPLHTAHARQIDGLGCIVHAPKLAQARVIYAAQCTEPRADCDPHQGNWFCASFKMNATTPLHVFATESETASAPVQEPAPTPAPVSPPTDDTDTNTSAPAESEQTNTSDNNNDTTANNPDNSSSVDSSSIDSSSIDNNVVDNSDEGNNQNIAPQTSARTPADITDLILITGQSNALGAGTSYDAVLDQPHPHAFAFTDQGWQVASLKQVWDRGWFPRTHPEGDPSNNFAIHFGKRFAENNPNRTVGFVLATAPGMAIDHWRYGGSFYREVAAKVTDAINQLPHKSNIDGVLWHQGETDANDTQAYTDALYTLIYYLRTEPWAGPTTRFICGETAQLPVNNRLNGLNRDSDPYSACVTASDLSTQADGHHFDAPALRTLGQRYADAYRDMLNR